MLWGAWFAWAGFNAAAATEITHVSATKNRIFISGKAEWANIGIVELAPYQSTNDLANAPNVVKFKAKGAFNISIPRWDDGRDRVYSGFLPTRRPVMQECP